MYSMGMLCKNLKCPSMLSSYSIIRRSQVKICLESSGAVYIKWTLNLYDVKVLQKLNLYFFFFFFNYKEQSSRSEITNDKKNHTLFLAVILELFSYFWKCHCWYVPCWLYAIVISFTDCFAKFSKVCPSGQNLLEGSFTFSE